MTPRAPASHPSIPTPAVLYESATTRIVRLGPGLVCKQYIGRGAGERMARERAVLALLAGIEGVGTPVAVAGPLEGLALRDAGAPLQDLLAGGPLPVEEILSIGLQVARILADVHRAGVIHGDVAAANLLRAPDGAITLVDFDHALNVADLRAGSSHEKDAGGTLATMSPEQTGRTGRPVDHRADLYSLGVVLYALATGHLPFPADDALELMRAHLVQRPTPPRDRRAELPVALSDLILRLLEKEPDRRYQGAEGLRYDLGLIQEAIGQGAPGPLPLGQHDFGTRLTPSEPVERTADIAALRALLDAGQSMDTCVLVRGAPGVGKTTLVNELRPLVAARQGWFLSTTFHEHRRDPFASAVVMRALGRLLLAEPEEQLAPQRERMRALVGGNLGLGATQLPEFQLLLGQHPRLAVSDPREAEARTNQVSIDLLRSVASPERPVVMVLDDLQWAPSITLNFLDAIVTAPQRIPGLLVVATYRGDTADGGDLGRLLARWRAAGCMPAELVVRPLSAAGVTRLVARMLRQPVEATQDLGEALFERTAGNPHDVVELVNALRQEGLLAYRDRRWAWNVAEVRAYVGECSVMSVLSRRILRLPEATLDVLRALACLGGAVRLGTLDAALGVEREHLLRLLAPAVDDGLVVPAAAGIVRFRHPRVHEAVLQGTAAPERDALHLAMARRLAGDATFAGAAAEQYLPVVDALTEPAERLRVAALLQGAADSTDILHFAASERYLAAAIRLLHLAGTADAARLHQLEVAHHQVLYGMGRLQEADALYASIAARCGDPVQLAACAGVQMYSLAVRRRNREAMELGLGLLQRLGLERPGDLRAALHAARARMEGWYGPHTMRADLVRPVPTDPALLATASLLMHTCSVSYLCDTGVFAWLSFEAQRLWQDHGPCKELFYGACTALTLPIVHRQEGSSVYAAVSAILAVGEARGFEPGTAMGYFNFCLSVAHWVEPVEQVVQAYRRTRDDLMRAGEQRMASYTYLAADLLLDCGATLDEAAAELEAGIAFAQRSGNVDSAQRYAVRRHLVRALRGERGDDAGRNDDFDEAAYAAGLTVPNADLATLHVLRAIAAAVFGNGATLADETDAAMRMQDRIPGYYIGAVLRTLHAVSRAERARRLPAPESRAAMQELQPLLRWLQERAQDAPANFLHLWKWVQAECAWTQGTLWEAGAAFDAAIEEAAGQQRPWHLAIVTERAALFHLRHGLEDSGRRLLALARDHYERWGAAGKVRAMEHDHAFLRMRAAPPPREAVRAPSQQPVSSDAMDLMAVVRASQSLSSETNLQQLRVRCSELLASLTGASRVVLAVWQEDAGKWMLPADGGGASVSLDDPAAASLLPLTAFRYAERTREVLVVEDARADDRFAEDPYIAGFEQCSLLLVPILDHRGQRAMLVLENHLRAAAFSGERLDAVKLISGQLAVSLENVLLYRELEQRVRERTEELRSAQAELVDTARRAGMAEIATSVLHNVGNVLNSVNVSADLVASRLRNSRVQGLARAVRMLEDHAAGIADFLVHDPKGRLLPDYLVKVTAAIRAEQEEIVQELASLGRSVDHIKEVVATQQAHAGTSSIVEPVDVGKLLEDALRINSTLLHRHGIAVVRAFGEVPRALLDRARVMQILVNLIRNAAQAMEASEAPRELTLELARQGDRLRVRVSDRGSGIAAENLTRIFSHGFTTRAGGHGFGLHSSALAAREMGGVLTAASAGPGQGATFVLEIPLQPDVRPVREAHPRGTAVAWQELD